MNETTLQTLKDHNLEYSFKNEEHVISGPRVFVRVAGGYIDPGMSFGLNAEEAKRLATAITIAASMLEIAPKKC